MPSGQVLVGKILLVDVDERERKRGGFLAAKNERAKDLKKGATLQCWELNLVISTAKDQLPY
jgi:hypothetical protein